MQRTRGMEQDQADKRAAGEVLQGRRLTPRRPSPGRQVPAHELAGLRTPLGSHCDRDLRRAGHASQPGLLVRREDDGRTSSTMLGCAASQESNGSAAQANCSMTVREMTLHPIEREK